MQGRAIGGAGRGDGAVSRASGRSAAAGRGGPFSLGMAGWGGAEAAAAGSAGTAAVASAGLLALQDGSSPMESRPVPGDSPPAWRRADIVLDELRDLQRDLLGIGRGGEAGLRRLAERLRDLDEPEDPGLREAVRAVALRAEIELARRGWDGFASAR